MGLEGRREFRAGGNQSFELKAIGFQGWQDRQQRIFSAVDCPVLSNDQDSVREHFFSRSGIDFNSLHGRERDAGSIWLCLFAATDVD